MNCNFQSISGQGFMTFKEPFTFPVGIFGNQTVFIQGENRDEPMAESNGSGKSNLLEALTFALFGRISKKLRYLDDIINLESEEAVVQVSFSLNGDFFTIKRNRSKNKTNEIHIYKRVDGEDKEEIEDSDNTEKQSYIEKLIGLSFLSYSHTVMFCQRFVAFPELKAPQRAAVLSEISGANVYLKAAEMAKERVTALRNLITDKEREKKHVEELLEQIDLNKISTLAEEWNEKQEETIADLRKQYATHRKNLADQRKKHEKNIKAEKLIILTLKDRVKDAETWLVDFPNVVKQKETKRTQYIQTDSQTRAAKTKIGEKQRELARLKETKVGNCPYCGQIIDTSNLDTHMQELAIDIDYLNREWATLNSICQDEKKQFEELEAKIEKLNDLKKQIRSTTSEITLREQTVINLENRTEENNLINLMKEVSNQIAKNENEENPFMGMEDKARAKVEEHHKTLEEYSKELSVLNDDLQYFVVWAENFPKLRMMLLDDLVSQLEVECQEWLSKYCSELSVELDTQRHTASGSVRDEVNITIITPKGKVSYEGYGGGETQKIRMAISLALSSIISEKAEREFNLIIFDESNVGLDRVGKESNIQVFKDLAEVKTVLIIEHDEYFQDKMDTEVTVVKENHKSLIQGV